MRRRKRSGRPHATEVRPGNAHKTASNSSPLPEIEAKDKRRGEVSYETRAALRPWYWGPDWKGETKS
jgi:hypothetical protein